MHARSGTIAVSRGAGQAPGFLIGSTLQFLGILCKPASSRLNQSCNAQTLLHFYRKKSLLVGKQVTLSRAKLFMTILNFAITALYSSNYAHDRISRMAVIKRALTVNQIVTSNFAPAPPPPSPCGWLPPRLSLHFANKFITARPRDLRAPSHAAPTATTTAIQRRGAAVLCLAGNATPLFGDDLRRRRSRNPKRCIEN